MFFFILFSRNNGFEHCRNGLSRKSTNCCFGRKHYRISSLKNSCCYIIHVESMSAPERFCSMSTGRTFGSVSERCSDRGPHDRVEPGHAAIAIVQRRAALLRRALRRQVRHQRRGVSDLRNVVHGSLRRAVCVEARRAWHLRQPHRELALHQRISRSVPSQPRGQV